MDETLKFIGTLTAIINACEDYKLLDVNNDREAMQAESISYNTIKEELEKFKEKTGGN